MVPLAGKRRQLSQRGTQWIERPIVRFAGIGVLSTIVYALLYLVLRAPLGPDGANALALAVTAVANTQANRYFTFGIRGGAGLVRQHCAGALVYVLALAITMAALGGLRRVDPHPGSLTEVSVLVVASVVATITRFLALRTWVFARREQPA
jgi:putative flippase GtrA